MGKIRVKVVVLPSRPSAREEVIAPWIEPCSEDLGLQALCERIVETFADLHEGKGGLTIKRIQDYDGNILSCRLTVGEALKESQSIADRTIQVVRLPPDLQELDNPLRFASIAPDSSARPQKSLQGMRALNARNRLSHVIDDESWAAESMGHRGGRSFKRQKLQDVGLGAARYTDRPLFPRNDVEDRPHGSLRSTGQRSSPVRLVEDAQRSPARKERTPYGTPSSLPVHSPFHIFSSSRNDVVAIPDSPERRSRARSDADRQTSSRIDTERAKSESPEMTVSVHSYPSPQSPKSVALLDSSTLKLSQPLITNALECQEGPGLRPAVSEQDIAPHARRSSRNLGVLPSKPPSHSANHALRSAERQQSSQVDPIGTTDELSQEQQIMKTIDLHDLDRLPYLRSTELNPVKSPCCNRTLDDRGDTQQDGINLHANTRSVQVDGRSVQPPSSPLARASSGSRKVSKPPLVEDPLGRLPPIAVSHKVTSDDAAKQPVLEKTDRARSTERHLQARDGRNPCKEDPQVFSDGYQERSLDHYPDSCKITELSVSNEAPVAKSHLVGRQTERASNSLMTAKAACLIPVADDPGNQRMHAEIGAASLNRDHEVPGTDSGSKTGRENSRPKVIVSTAKQVTTQPRVAENSEQMECKIITSMDPSPGGICYEKQQRTEAMIKENLLASETEAVAPDLQVDQALMQDDDAARDESSEFESLTRKINANNAVNAIEMTSKTEQKASPPDGQEPEGCWTLKVPKKKVAPGVDTLSHKRAEDQKRTLDQQPEQHLKARTNQTADEKHKAEERAKREADAIKHYLAQDRTKQKTPSSSTGPKRKRDVFEQVAEPSTDCATVQKKCRSSGTRGQPSTSSRFCSASIDKRRSMTPLYPSSSALKPSKEAARTSESSSRRSVSFNDNPIATLALLTPTASTLKRPKNGIFSGAATPVMESTSSSRDDPRSKKMQSNIPDQAATIQINNQPSDSRGRSKVTTKSANPSSKRQLKPKVQTKLSVTRDVKLKGRAEERLMSGQSGKRQARETSSESENSASTFYSDEEGQMIIARAGSSKKRNVGAATKPADAILETQSGQVQQPGLPPSKIEAKRLSGNKTMLAKDDALIGATNREISRSRSPARHMSRASLGASEVDSPTASGDNLNRASDESASEYNNEETDTNSEEDLRSLSNLAESRSSTTSSEKKLRTSQHGEDDFKTASATLKFSENPPKRTSKSASSRSEGSGPSDSADENKIAQEMDQQLQREHRESVQASQSSLSKIDQRAPKSAKSTPSPSLVKKPGNSRFPSLSGLRGRASQTKNTAAPAPKTPVTSRAGLNPTRQPWAANDEDRSSSSDSEDESSSSDNERNKTPNSSQNIPEPLSGPIRGIRSILKRTFPSDEI